MIMKVVYICHPVSGNVPNNIKKILNIVRDINLTMPDVVPFVPYLADILALDDDKPEERERGIRNDIAILGFGIISELWIYGRKISKGMEDEIELAYVKGIPIILMDPGTEVSTHLRMIMNKGY